MKDVCVSLYLDIRKEKKNGKYPVKLRVYTSNPRKQKLYPTPFDFTEEDFHSIWETKKPAKEKKGMRFKLQTIERDAQEIAYDMKLFTFEKFEKKLFGEKGEARNVNYFYQQAIKQYRKNEQIGTASNYDLSLKSLMKYHGEENLPFTIITPQWLSGYEKFMIEDEERSLSTVGIYLRPLRAILNTALAEHDIDQDMYPFGRRKYQIPSPRSVKKALNKNQLRLLFDNVAPTPEQEKAKEFFFFSFFCNGMNIKDIALLRYKDLSGDVLTFRREKTKRTKKDQEPIIVYLNNYTRNIITLRGKKPVVPGDYIFDILEEGDDADTRYSKTKNFTRFVSQHITNYGKSLGIKEKISTYWARHSYSTTVIRDGYSMEYVSEALGHSNLSTTKRYFAGFEDDKKKEIANKLLEF